MRGRRVLITFDHEVDADEVAKAVEHLGEIVPPIVVVGRNVQIESRPPDICLREVKPEEEAIRRIVRDEMSRL